MPGGHVVKTEGLFLGDPLPRPYVLKPVNEGSSVGVAIVTAESNYGEPIARDAKGPWQEFDELLAEPFIRGRELTTAVLGDRALGVTELRPKSGFYDYDAKYTEGMTDHICPANVPAGDCRGLFRHGAEARIACSAARGRAGRTFAGTTRKGVEGLYPPRSQYPAGHDAAKPCAGAGQGGGDQLRRIGADDFG